MKKITWITLFLLTGIFTLQAQYNPQKLFDDDLYNHKGDFYRSASGSPTTHYWQNEANYTIEAAFSPKTKLLKGQVQIEYTNNSPDQLHYLWLQMDQNDVQKDARKIQMMSPMGMNKPQEGYHIHQLEALKNGKKLAVEYAVYGTRMQVKLEKSLNPGEKINLKIDYDYTLRKQGGGGRSGYMENEDGGFYEISYWYPRMAVYDDYYGWNTLPFVGGGEMYLDYGDIDYKITVPYEQVVVGSGKLVNAEKILNKKTLTRLDKAGKSDQTVMIRKSSEIGQPVTQKTNGKVTWHFKMKNTRDVAFATSSSYIWDAAKINLPSGKTALAQSVYPKGATENGAAWKRSTEMLKYSVEFFSKNILEYPYETSTSVGGSVGGMEFPGFVFNSWKSKPYSMFLLASHEIGHTWFPMIVGSDERRDPFLDEGINVFFDIYAQEHFNNGEFAPKRDGEYAPNGGNPNDEIIPIIEKLKNGPTIMTPPDNMNYQWVHPLQYFKTAHGLVLLREVILGHKKFDYAIQQYAKNWAYKHPRPEDFFRSMENGSGEDLKWFWNGWFYHNWQLDQGIKSVKYRKDHPKNGALITVENHQKMAMPILVHIEEENGNTQDLKIPVDVWKFGNTATFGINSTSTLKKVVLDQNHELPDTDRSNNTWKK